MDAGQLRYGYLGSDTLVQADIDGDGNADATLILLGSDDDDVLIGGEGVASLYGVAVADRWGWDWLPGDSGNDMIDVDGDTVVDMYIRFDGIVTLVEANFVL